jgi:hypothetical protein
MIAELLENATRFSPRAHQVHVLGRVVPFGYQLDIMDEGLGMGEEELAPANRRIELAGQERTDTKVLGHHVVGRLARRRGIRVRLIPSPTPASSPQLMVPQALLSSPLPAERPREAPVAEAAAGPGQPVAERAGRPSPPAARRGHGAHRDPRWTTRPRAAPVAPGARPVAAAPVAAPAEAYEARVRPGTSSRSAAAPA